MYTHSQTQTVISVPYKRWLMISGRGSWAQEVQSGSDFINTSWHEHHLHALTHPRPPTHTHRRILLYPFLLAILCLSCCLRLKILPVAVMRDVRWWVMRGWLGRVGVSQGQALHALTFFGLFVPLSASLRLFVTAASTTNNWTTNEDKWYDCRARPTSQSAS